MFSNIKRSWKAICLLLILLGAVIYGFFWRYTLKDIGLSKAKTVSDFYSLEPTLRYVWGENAEDTKTMLDALHDSPEIYTEPLSDSSIIAVVTAGQQALQTNGSLGQEVSVERVIKGEEQIASGDVCFVFQYFGFSLSENKLYYSNTANILQPGQSYLIFMEPSELNRYNTSKTFYIEQKIFSHINIRKVVTPTLRADYETVRFSDVCDYEFFCISEPLTAAFNQVRSEILKKYLAL